MESVENEVAKLSVADVPPSAPASAATADVTPPVPVDVSKLSDQELIRFLADKEVQRAQERQQKRLAKQNEEKDHKFWNTQPVPQKDDNFEGDSGPLDAATDLSAVKKEPYSMPAGFEWCSIDVKNTEQIQEMYTLLTENYVEDDDCLFRFDYAVPFLQWALTPPGYLLDWHFGVRNTKTGKLMGCITAIPADVNVHGQYIPMVEINFLCVHKKLR